jgi:hypothetical protein
LREPKNGTSSKQIAKNTPRDAEGRARLGGA